jgi:hypothetical protein
VRPPREPLEQIVLTVVKAGEGFAADTYRLLAGEPPSSTR